jgi:hypothetical protein
VTDRILALVVANVLMLALGAGMLPLLRLARTRRELLTRLPLAYPVGIAGTGILTAHLALLHVPIGRIGLPVLSATSLVLGLRRLPGGHRSRRARNVIRALPALTLLAVTAAFFVQATRLFAVKPLVEFDGWAIWATRAQALYDFGHPVAPVFTDPTYPALQYPLLLPSLEALDFRFMGTFDGSLIHLQLLGFAIAFVSGAWILLRNQAPSVLLAAVLLAIVTAPTFFHQLPSNFADVPLALFVALGVASLAAWLASGGQGLLPAAALLLGAAALTKNEGELFALAAYASAFLAAGRSRRRPVALAAAATFALELPWRIWVQAHHLPTRDYALSNLFDPSYLWHHRSRVGPSAHELLTQIWASGSWSYIVPLVLLGLAAAPLMRRTRVAAFGAAWLVLSFAGLVAIYWISRNPLSSHLFNSSDRTIDSLVIGGALLVPVLLSTE